jgi:TolC family type I secretion outer membrane protein
MGQAAAPREATAPARTSLPLRASAIGDRMNASLLAQVRSGDAGSDAALQRMATLILASLDVHPDVQAVTQQVGASQSAMTEARSGWLPQVSASVDAGERRATNSTVANATVTTQSGLGYGASVRQLLYDFGTTSATIDSARSREEAAQFRLQSRRSDVALRAASAWLELERARQLRALAEDNLRSRNDIVELVQERFEVGGSSRADVIRAQARSADARAALVTADTALRSALPAYREAFGREPQATELPANMVLPTRGIGDATPQTLTLTQMAERYGGVRESLALLDSGRAEARAADGRGKPVFNVELNGNRRENGIGGVPTTDTAALVVMRYNLFTGYADRARREQAWYRVSQTEQELASLIRQVERNIEQAQAQVDNADAILNSRQSAVQTASESLMAVKELFAFNRGSLLDLLRVQEDLYNAGRDLINASIDRRIAQYRLLHLVSDLEPRLTQAAGVSPRP